MGLQDWARAMTLRTESADQILLADTPLTSARAFPSVVYSFYLPASLW